MTEEKNKSIGNKVKVEKVFENINELNIREISELLAKFKEELNIKEEMRVGSVDLNAKQEENTASVSNNVSLKLLAMSKEDAGKAVLFKFIKDLYAKIKDKSLGILEAGSYAKEGSVIIEDVERSYFEKEEVKKQLEKMEKTGTKFEIK